MPVIFKNFTYSSTSGACFFKTWSGADLHISLYYSRSNPPGSSPCSVAETLLQSHPMSSGSHRCSPLNSLHYPRPQLQQDSLGTHRLLWPGKQISYLQIFTTPSTLLRSITQVHPQVCSIPQLCCGFSSISTPRRWTKQILVEHPSFLPLVKPLHPTPSPFPFRSLKS